MKEYNIFLKRQPEGKIIIYMLPYHSTLSLDALKILLDVDVKETAKKMISVTDGIVLSAKVLGTLKRALEKFQNEISIEAGGILSGHLCTRDDDCICTRDGVEIDAVQRSPYLPVLEMKNIGTISNSIEIGAGGVKDSTLPVFYRQILNEVVIGIELQSSADFTKKTAEHFDNAILIKAEVSDTVERVFEEGDSPIEIGADLEDLKYKIRVVASNLIQLSASVSVGTKRKRWLSEVADLPLSETGMMGMQEFFYVVIE